MTNNEIVHITSSEERFVNEAESIVQRGRDDAYHAINYSIVSTYWQLGKHIIAEELTGTGHAQNYGQHLMELLEQRLVPVYGNSYSKRNLYFFAQFYQQFPDFEIVNACVHNLTWTHSILQSVSCCVLTPMKMWHATLH
ncbi:MAG: DUF1016 N-terminal domain-containing protein [Paludibacteraceae bacterium]|nr:DUF1016 N-terminal domain-containing protein [Paludibacteraceae bacterium]